MPRRSTTTPLTPLTELLRKCSPEEREWLATQAGTEVNYLYSLAGCHRGKSGPSLKLGLAIATAAKTLHEKAPDRIPLVTADALATMCDVAGLDG
jgi:hypothetical protein